MVLPAPFGPDQAADFAAPDIEGNAVERDDATETQRNVADAEQVIVHRACSRIRAIVPPPGHKAPDSKSPKRTHCLPFQRIICMFSIGK